MITTPKSRFRNEFGDICHTYRGFKIKPEYTYSETSRFAGNGAFNREPARKRVYRIWNLDENKYFPFYDERLRECKEWIDERIAKKQV